MKSPIDQLVIAFLCVGVFFFALAQGHKKGNEFVKGVDFILDQCYNIGGVVVREDKSTIVCNRGSPLSDAEFNEIKPLLTKKEEWRTLQNLH